MTTKHISFTLLIIILLSALSVSANASTYNKYSSQATPITAEIPKVTLGQGTAGTSTIYTNNTSARASIGSEATWLTGWTCRKSHVVNYSAGAGTNYQIRIKVYYGSGVDSGENVYSSAKCRTDFGDIRFTGGNGTTLLNCWMESKVDSDSAVFWVKIADNLSTVNAAIYVYYGKANAVYPYLASARAHGDATFLFFDDFTAGLSRWNREITSGVYPEIPNGTDYVRCGGGSTSSPYGLTSLGSSSTYSGFLDGAIEFRLRTTTDALGEIVYRGNFAANTGYKARYDCRTGTEQSFMKPSYSGWSGFGPTVTRFGDGTGVWYRGTITVLGSTFNMYKDGVLKNTATDATYSSSGEIALQNHYGSWTDYDWVAVRKIAASEPGHGTWGSEESGQTFDYVLTVVNQASNSWNIRLRAYDQTNVGRLSNCTIYFRNSTGVSRQIYVYNGVYSQQVGSWYYLTSLSMVYIVMTAAANTSGTSNIYVYLEVQVPNTSTSNLMVLTFEIS